MLSWNNAPLGSTITRKAIFCLMPGMAGTLQILFHSLLPKNPIKAAIILTILQISKPKSLPKVWQQINEG